MATPGQKVYPRIDEARAIGTFVEGPARISGLDWDSEDKRIELITTNALAFRVTAPSLREQGCIDTDVSFELRVPGINQTSCDSAASVDWPGALLQHYASRGIYKLAHDHESWVGSGGVGSPNAAGAFAVSGMGALRLMLACNREVRIANVPLGTAPDAPPTVYMTRKADFYFETEGVREAVYCWLGWPILRWTLTAPADCTLTVAVLSRWDTGYNDNHMTGASRSAELALSTDEATYHWEIEVAAGTHTYEIELAAPMEGGHPLHERIVEIEVTGFADGNWTLTEPELALDQAVAGTHCSLKTHEGYEYLQGGASAHVDSAYEALYVDESNLGSRNIVERTLAFFCRLIGEATGYDLTTAWGLAAFCTLIERASDAWTCSRNEAAWEAACKDADGNVLSECWGFDICAPEGVSEPLQQGVDGGTANCALRCGTWELERGIVYTLRPDKVLEGRMHGNLVGEGGKLVRSKPNSVQVWQREPGGEWEAHSTASSGEAGHWCSASLPECVPDSQTAYDYAAAQPGEGGGEAWGRAPAREFIAGSLALLRRYDPALDVELGGITWRVTTDNPEGGKLAVAYTGAQHIPSWVRVAAPSAAEVFTRPSIAVVGGDLLVAATDTEADTMRLFRSRTRGATWEEVGAAP